jgi:hypothetical protein
MLSTPALKVYACIEGMSLAAAVSRQRHPMHPHIASNPAAWSASQIGWLRRSGNKI